MYKILIYTSHTYIHTNIHTYRQTDRHINIHIATCIILDIIIQRWDMKWFMVHGCDPMQFIRQQKTCGRALTTRKCHTLGCMLPFQIQGWTWWLRFWFPRRISLQEGPHANPTVACQHWELPPLTILSAITLALGRSKTSPDTCVIANQNLGFWKRPVTWFISAGSSREICSLICQ